jgi:flavodoxin I
MSKVLLVYASMSGNTEEMADLIDQGLQKEGIEVDKNEILDVSASDMEEYDSIILGAYTWGEGELPDEFEDFYDDMATMDLTGKTFAVFGSGDTSYDIFCGAVDLIEAMVAEKGGKLTLEGLKVELNPEGDDHDRCIQFGIDFAKIINGVKA